MAGAWGLTLTIGWVYFLTPVGLGVRAGLAFTLFAQVLDAPTASHIVIASRITTLGVDLVFVEAVELLALGLSRGKPGRAATSHESAEGSVGYAARIPR